MPHVQNTTEMELGFDGIQVRAGEIVEVSDRHLAGMVGQTGGKFVEVTPEAVSEAHRHRYKPDEEICSYEGCGHVKGSRGGNGDSEPSDSGPSDEAEKQEVSEG